MTIRADAATHRTVAARIDVATYSKIEALAQKHGISLSAWLRSVVVDAILDEDDLAERHPPNHEIPHFIGIKSAAAAEVGDSRNVHDQGVQR